MSSCQSRIAAVRGLSSIAACIAVVAGNVPLVTHAQSYLPPRITQRASTSVQIGGPGTVVVQVQVMADGSHKVQKIIATTNPGDVPAAMDIAKNSTYAPARRSGKPVASYNNFTFRFTGKSSAGVTPTGSSGSGTVRVSSTNVQIEQMIKSGNYTGAQARLQAVLQRNPNDTLARELSGLSHYYQKDFVGAAQEFQKVPTIEKTFTEIAAQSFASAAISYAMGHNGVQADPNLAMQYAKQSIQLAPSANSYFSLGIVQLQAKDSAGAIASFKQARDLGFANPKTDAASRSNLDGGLLQAYAQAGDLKNADLVAQEIKKLDPGSTLPTQVLGQAYLQSGYNDSQAKRTDSAIANFMKAASYGDPMVTAQAYAQAAFVMVNKEQPDYAKAKEYADKAIAADSNSALANWAEGVTFTQQAVQNGNADAKKQALAYCTKASQIAKSQGNASLASSIDKYIETNNLK